MPATEAPVALKLIEKAWPPIFRSRREVRQHNLAARRANEDLTSWVQDEAHAFTRQLGDIDNELNRRNLFFSGERVTQRLEAKRGQLQRYRDRRRDTERIVEDLRASEGAWHRWWRSSGCPRRLRLDDWPTHARQAELEGMADRWRESEIGGDGRAVPVVDPA